jgi:hypothetical protein
MLADVFFARLQIPTSPEQLRWLSGNPILIRLFILSARILLLTCLLQFVWWIFSTLRTALE